MKHINLLTNLNCLIYFACMKIAYIAKLHIYQTAIKKKKCYVCNESGQCSMLCIEKRILSHWLTCSFTSIIHFRGQKSHCAHLLCPNIMMKKCYVYKQHCQCYVYKKEYSLSSPILNCLIYFAYIKNCIYVTKLHIYQVAFV